MTTTIEEVDLRLTVTKNELVAEDQRLWESLQNETISRVAGDNANSQLVADVNTANQGTESRLSTEVIHRSEGDLINVNSINALTQALSDYRIKTDLELATEKLAREQLGIDLNIKISNAVASFDHREHQIYTAIGIVQTDLDDKYISMSQRIAKYEDMLQDITTDSIQITMDNGEINMGAWTILSQAREWDLEILGKFKDYQTIIDGDLDQALQDLQNKLPVEQDIIDKAIEALSQAPIIKELDDKLAQNLTDINAINNKLVQQAQDTAIEMINLSQALTAEVVRKTDEIASTVVAETDARVFEISKETATRVAQVELLNDGLTQETLERIEGDNASIEMINNLKLSNDTSLANIREELTVTTGKVEANAAQLSAIDARVTVAQADATQAITNAASATQKAEAAAAANEVTAGRVSTVEASLGGKVDTTAFNSLETKVNTIDGKTTTNTADITGLKTRMTDAEGNITTNTTAVNQLQIKNTEQDGKLTTLTSDTTTLKADMVVVKNDLTTKASTQSVQNLQNEVTTQGGLITANTQAQTALKASFDNMAIGGDNLLVNSNFANDWANWSIWGSATRSFESLSGKRYARLVANDTNYFKGISQAALVPFIPDTEYTVSFLAYTLSASPQKIQMLVHQSGGGTNDPQINMATGNLTALPKRYSLTFRSTNNTAKSTFNFFFGGGFGAPFDVCVSDIQFEVGNKASAWKPSNKELTNSISANATAVSNMQAQITTIDGKVTSNTNNLTNLTGRVTNVETNTTANTNAINTMQGTITSQGNQITANTGAITGVETSLNNAADATNNLAINSNVVGTYNGVAYPHLAYALDKACVVGQQYTLLWCGEHQRGTGDTNSNLSVYIGGGQQTVDSITNQAKTVRKVTFIKANNMNDPTINFYCINRPTADKGTVATVYWAVLVKGPTILGNDWFPGSYEMKPTVEGHTSAINTLNTNVSLIDGKATAASEASTRVEAKLADGINTRNYLLDSATGGTKTVLTAAMSKLLFPGTVISMAFDIDITSPVSAGSRNRIGYETSFNLAAGASYVGVWLNNAASQPVGKYRIKNQFTIPAGWTNGASVFPSSFPYINQTSGGAFTISNVTMTVSSIPVGWEPAPEDSSNAINTLQTQVTNIDGRVTATSNSLTQLQTTVDGHTSTIAIHGQSINGIQAEYSIKLDVNGLVSGIGLINTGTSSAIGINADYFYVGKPANGKKPFMILTSSQTIGGVTYPAGTWIDVALIANATIGTAHIANAAITNAKIANLAVDNSKIANLDASKINAGFIAAARIQAGTVTADKLSVTELSAISGNLGTLITYKDPAQPLKARMVMQGSLITVYDDNNVVRVRLGLW